MSSEQQNEENNGSIDLNSPLPSRIQDLCAWRGNFFRQSNYLVEAIFEQPFKEFELKVLGVISKHISENNSLSLDQEGKLIKISINKEDFCRSLNIEPQNFYQQAKSLTPDLHRKSLFIEILKTSNPVNKTKKEFRSVVLVPEISCKDNQITFWISPVLQPYLQKLRVEYTLLSLEYMSRMGSSYAIKIYQLLAQYQKIGKRTFGISELKKIMGISNKYREFQRFKTDVIETAVKHINESSNLQISYKVEIPCRRAESIIFRIETKETQFQQAIKEFIKEMDKILSRGCDFYVGDHEKLRENWKKSKKDPTHHLDLFNFWIEHRTIEYNPKSIHPLQKRENDHWYLTFREESYKKMKQKWIEISRTYQRS
jgi:ribosome-associated translation inhibitor RaiA